MIVGFDIDGVLTHGVDPGVVEAEGDQVVVISGRTWPDYDGFCRALAQRWPVYVRGSGAYGDRQHAAAFKATMIGLLGVGQFWDDDPVQLEVIHGAHPDVVLVHVHGDDRVEGVPLLEVRTP